MRARLEKSLAIAAALFAFGCRRTPPDAADAGEPAEPPAAPAAPAGEVGARAPRLEAGGRVDAACTGMEVRVDEVLLDPRCAVDRAEAKRLADVPEAGAPRLRQEARRADDGTVTVRVVNVGSEPAALPLSWHPRLPAFTALAEGPDRAIYELEPPALQIDAGAPERARFARVVLPPGGAVTARATLGPGIARRLDRACPDGGVCAPPRLPRGAYAVHVGELVVDLEAGPPARIEWEVP